MLSKFLINFGQRDGKDAKLELTGSREWLEKIVPFLLLIIGGLTKSYGFNLETTDRIRELVNNALDCLQTGTNFAEALGTENGGALVALQLDSVEETPTQS